ncbi:MAG: hypothetical protein ACJ8FY_05805 [Gemmataceae bacterium]
MNRASCWFVVSSLFLAAGLAKCAETPTIRLKGDPPSAIEIAGLSAKDIDSLGKLGLKGEAWTPVFAVYVIPAEGKERGSALLGSYRIEDGAVRFEPRFPIVRGVRYRVIFNLKRIPSRAALEEKPLAKEILLAKPKTEPTQVTQVYPTVDRLPENQLKFYLHFSAPMSRGDSYKHIKLLDENGKAVDLPFLELDQELWDSAGQRLTVFCDPGRIKRGLKPREEFGPVLEEGKRYTLVIDRDLEDANGNALKETFRKPFRAVAPNDTQPDPKTWKVQPPAAGTKKPVTVIFPKPMDQALLERLVWVIDDRDQKLAGKVTVGEKETVWQFIPEKVWQEGTYHVVADTRLEDLAGNSIARPFEVDVFRPVERQVKKETVKIPFKAERGESRKR